MLVDVASTHIWKPLLHEVAAGTLGATESIEYLAQAHRSHFQFRLGKMEGLDRALKQIHVGPTLSHTGEELIPRRTFAYDTLVLAVGSISNTFNTLGVNEHCLFLDNTEQALSFQQQLLETYIKNHAAKETNVGKPLSIAIVGAGATGVELAAQLHEVSQVLSVYGLEQAGNVNITIIEAATQLLPALPAKLAAQTEQQLQRLGIVLKLGERVVEVTKDSIKTQTGEIFPADIKVWAAGIKAPDWMQGLGGMATNKLNQLQVDATLKTSDEHIFAIGDCAACVWTGHPGAVNVPPRAQAAHQQASTLSKSLQRRLENKPLLLFVYYDYGSLVSLGRYSTVGNLMGNLMGTVTIGGFIARVVYLSLYKMHQVAIHGYFRTTMLTLSNLFRRSALAKFKMH